jgi:hypothetical protein
MKTIILLALLAVSSAAVADDINDMENGVAVCMDHLKSMSIDRSDPKSYYPGFEGCAALMDKWIEVMTPLWNAAARKQKATEIEIINQGRKAARLPPLPSE